MKLVPVAAAAMVGILLAGPAAAQTRRYVGRPVADVLKTLQSPELSFIFTSDSVPQTLLVKSEPRGRDNRDLARQILAEHCRELKRGPGRLMIVVQGKCPAVKKPVTVEPESIHVAGDPLKGDHPEVLVSGEAGQASQLFNPARREGTYTLAPSTVLEMAGALDNVSHALGKLPSVTAVPGQDSKLAVRGAGPEHNMVVVDGVQIHNPYRLGTFTSSFLNPATAAGVKLDPSGLDARFGGRLSSVTSIDLRDGVSDRALAVSGSVGMMAGDLLLEGRLPGNDGASWWAAARGTSHRPLFNRFSDDQVPGFADAQFKTTLLPTEHTRLTLYGLVGREMSDERDRIYPANAFGIVAPDDKLFDEGAQYTGNNRLGVMNFSWTPGARLAATTTASTYAHEARERDAAPAGLGRPSYQRDLLVRDHSLRQRVLLFRPGGDQLLDTGVELHWLQSQWRMDGTKPLVNSWESGPRPRGLGPTTEGELVEYADGPIDTRLERTQIGWWAQYRLPLGSRTALEPGVRLDWNSFTHEALWQPRVRLSGRVGSSIWWTGYAEQAQTPSHETLQGYDYVQLNAADGGRLKSERSRQIVAGVERTLLANLTLRLEAYGRRFDHLLEQRLETDDQRALRLSRLKIPTDLPADSMLYEPRPTVVADSIGRGSSKGLEVQVERAAGMVRGFVSYSYSRSRREMYGDTFPSDFDRPHAVKAVLFMQPWRRVRLAVTSERGSGVPVTPLISESFNRKPDGSFAMTVNPNMRRVSLRNTDRLNGYGRTDVRVTWSTLGHWEFYAEMLNVFGEEIVHHVQMPSSIGGPRETDWEVARSDRWLPSFGLRVKF